jgi:hypothetical protein
MDEIERSLEKGESPTGTIPWVDKDDYLDNIGLLFCMFGKHKTRPDVIADTLESLNITEIPLIFKIIISSYLCNKTSLKHVVENMCCVPAFEEMIKTFIPLPSFYQHMGTISYIYNKELTDIGVISKIKEMQKELENETNMIYPEVDSYLRRINIEYAEIPSWVSLGKDEGVASQKYTSFGLDKETDEPVFMKDDDSWVCDREMDQIKNMKCFGEGGEEVDVSKIVEDFAKDVIGAKRQGENERKSFRVWGPLNNYPNSGCIGTPNNKGPCRMLTCLCRNSDEGSGQISDVWFKGECDRCGKKIKNFSHALRYPEEEGGWKGCYCCVKCITSELNLNTKDRARVGRFQEQLKEIGIMDQGL